jgi:hypothetical protein
MIHVEGCLAPIQLCSCPPIDTDKEWTFEMLNGLDILRINYLEE